jgi:PAS domain S-box-containing protein
LSDPSHRVEQELFAERERLRITLASIGDAVVSTDADGRVVFLNAVAERLTGWTQAEAAGQPLDGVFRIINETTRAAVENPALRALREGRVADLANHTLLVARDGSEHPIDDSAAPMLGPDGRPLGAVLVFRDVSERKRAEEARARLAAIVESSEDAIVSKTLEGVILSWNAGAERVFGYPAAEAVGQNITLLIPPDRLGEETQIVARLKQGLRIEHFETVRVAKGGRLIDISLSVSPIKDDEGHVIGAAKIARDITARKRADEALRVSERGRQEAAEQLALAVTAAGLGDWSWDATTDTMAFSSRAAAILGLPPGTNSTRMELQALIHEEDRERATAEVARSIAGHRQYDVEYRLTRPDGEQVWISSKGRAQYRGDGSTSGIFGVVQDVTERKRLEQELWQRAEALADADRRKDEFIALLAHELRNPLAPIRAGLQLLQLGVADAGVLERARAMMDRQLTHMVRLIDDLLDVSRISTSRLNLQKKPVLLVDIVTHALEAVGPAMQAAGHTLEVHLPEAPVVLDADLTRLAQVFGNLLSNSAKYTPHGGQISLSAEVHEADLVVTVKDNGIGIPAHALPRVFDMFSQVDRNVERGTGGLGVGLALVKGLVETHGGAVRGESAGPGQGSTFTVVLPIHGGGDPLSSTTMAPAEPVAVPARRKIVIADDSVDGAEAMAELLEALGNEAHVTHDGLSVVKLVERVRPQLVLMDVGMPGQNGLDATRQIREQPWGQQVTIIALTGWGQESDRQRSHHAGCDGHLVKPIDFPKLEKLLRELPDK